jgi:DNA primase
MTTNRRHGLLDYAAIRARISIGDVLALLNYRPHRTQATKCRGRCPLHQNDQPPDSQSTCFSVDLQRNLFQCFGCGAQGNQLDLWRLHTRLPLYQATLELCERAHIDPPRKPTSATPE